MTAYEVLSIRAACLSLGVQGFIGGLHGHTGKQVSNMYHTAYAEFRQREPLASFGEHFVSLSGVGNCLPVTFPGASKGQLASRPF